MGFIQKNDGQDDDLLGSGKKEVKRESEARGHSGLTMDLDVKVCENCRTELLPWQDTCPEDGGRGVRPDELPPRRDDLLERFLEREAEDTGKAEMLPDPDRDD